MDVFWNYPYFKDGLWEWKLMTLFWKNWWNMRTDWDLVMIIFFLTAHYFEFFDWSSAWNLRTLHTWSLMSDIETKFWCPYFGCRADEWSAWFCLSRTYPSLFFTHSKIFLIVQQLRSWTIQNHSINNIVIFLHTWDLIMFGNSFNPLKSTKWEFFFPKDVNVVCTFLQHVFEGIGFEENKVFSLHHLQKIFHSIHFGKTHLDFFLKDLYSFFSNWKFNLHLEVK